MANEASTIEFPQKKPAETAYDLHEVENASADLFVADVMITACDRFVCDVRGWLDILQEAPVSPNGMDGTKHSLVDLDTMLSELRQKIAEAKGKIDQHVDETFQKRRQATA